MKRLLRSRGVQAALGWLLAGYLRLILVSVRWRQEGLEAVEQALAEPGGMLGFLWHGRIPLSVAAAPVWWRRNARVLVSPSADGEFISQALNHNGFPTIRGSTAKPGDAEKTLMAAGAFREAMRLLKGGGGLVISPDGPRGPAEVISSGSMQIARRSGATVFLMGLAVRPAHRLTSWDRAMVGLPFGRGAIVWVGPLRVPADADEAAVDALRADWAEHLNAANLRAEAMVA